MLTESAAEPAGGDERAPVGLRFELFVDDVEVSVRFYGATLGLRPPASWSPDGYVPLHAGAITIGVQHHTKLPPGHYFTADHLSGPRGVGVEVVVEVNDVDAAYARAAQQAERHGGHVQPLTDRPWGLRDFRLIDPDGYYVRVTSRRD